MPRSLVAANEARMEGSVHYEELMKEIITFRDKWLLHTKDLSHIFGIPQGTVDSILNANKSFHVKKETAAAVRRAIRDYNPRTCRYRRFPKADVAKILVDIKKKHNFTWDEVAEIVDYPKHKIWNITSAKSCLKHVPVETVRHIMLGYQNYLKRRAETLARDSRHKIA